jgi:hypothetical protein
MVGRRIQVQRGAPWAGDLPHTRLVVIGAPGALADDELQRRLDTCVYRTPRERLREALRPLLDALRGRRGTSSADHQPNGGD